MRTPFRRLPPAVLLILALVVAVGCGGGGNDKDAQALLDKAFNSKIDSADLKLDAEVKIDGVPGFNRPVRVVATGPFRNNDDKLPSTDLEVKIGTGGQAVQTGFLSTGDRAFLKFQDVYYEQPREQVEQANKSISSAGGDRKTSLKSLGLDPRRWLEDAQSEGDEKVGGVETEHVKGKLDISSVVADFNTFVKRSAGAIGGATGQAAPRPLTKKELDKIADVVDDPTFDVYVAKEDNTIRRLSGHLDVDVPEEDRDSVSGIEGGSFSFTIEFTKVNGDQRIVAPARARPLSELTGSLGTGLLGGGSGGSGSSTTPAPPPSSGPGTSSYKRYADCLDRADPQDTDALQRCADLLQ